MSYLVTNARHTRELITLSYNADVIMIRTFDYVYPAKASPRMTLSSVTSDVMQYTGGVGLYYNGKEYNQRWYQCLSWSRHQLEPGSTYVWATDDVIGRVFQIDSEKLPNLDISDWRYLRMCSFRPFFKLQVDYPNQPFSEMQKVFYSGGDEYSTAIISPEEITEVMAEDPSLVPQFSYEVKDGVIYVEGSRKCCGLLHTFNRKNILIDDYYELQGHKACIPFVKMLADQTASFDLTFSYNKVLKISV